MEFLQCVSGRRSIRTYEAAPVPRETMERVIQSASYAPSWKNSQTARYIVVEDKSVKDGIADNCVLGHPGNNRIIKSAPALIVLASVKNRAGFERDGSPTTSKGDGWEMFDAGIAAQTLCLAAYNEGLGTVIMGIFDEDAVAAAIGLPDDQRVSALIAIGTAAESPAMPKRKTVEELLRYI